MATTKTESVVIGAILEAMDRKDINQKDLAKVLNLHRTTVCSKFTHRRFTAQEIFKICDYLGIQFVAMGE